jgi:cytochrome c biogenesis protein CcmG/thiol:disulfide interchange protein DsbE
MNPAVRAVQALALLAVAGLFGVLAWRIAHRVRPAVPVYIRPSHPVTSPEFDLPRLDGRGNLSLASLRGKAVVLNFWASFCYGCKQEMRALEAAWRRNRARGLVVIGIEDSGDSARDARSLARRMGVTYPLVRDVGFNTSDRFAVAFLPETLFVNRRGQVVGTRIEGGIQLKSNREAFRQGIELAAGE